MKNCLELLWIYLLVFPCDMERSNSQTLEVCLLKVRPSHQSLVDYTYCDIEGLWPHFELIVELSEPINKVLSILV